MRAVLFGVFALILFISCCAQEFDFVPDVVPDNPLSVLDVRYGELVVENGNLLTPTSVKDQPSVTWNADEDSYYTLTMTDPDAPDRKNSTLREFLHWKVVNIPGNNITKGETFAGYIGGDPPRGAGAHRYVFIVFKQPGKLNFDERRISSTDFIGRALFSTHKFAQKYNMEEPAIGGIDFLLENVNSVPVVQKQLSG